MDDEPRNYVPLEDLLFAHGVDPPLAAGAVSGRTHLPCGDQPWAEEDARVIEDMRAARRAMWEDADLELLAIRDDNPDEYREVPRD
jgi:hypothetical protein